MKRELLRDRRLGLVRGEEQQVRVEAGLSRPILTVIASGRMARGCGFTTTALPVTSEAKRPG
jgi:hypothetical protein